LKKTITVASVTAEIDRISKEICELEAQKKVLQRMLAPCEDSTTTTKRQRPNSKYRQAIDILASHSDGLTIKQLVEKAEEKGLLLQMSTINSQLSKEANRKGGDVVRRQDGKYVHRIFS